MPAQEQSHRFQYAVLWEKTGYGDDGQPTLDEPEELLVRWVRRSRQIRDADGNLINIDATVTLGREVAVGSVMWEGELEDWYDVGSGGANTNLMEVVMSSAVPDVKNREVSYKAMLAFYKGSL